MDVPGNAFRFPARLLPALGARAWRWALGAALAAALLGYAPPGHGQGLSARPARDVPALATQALATQALTAQARTAQATAPPDSAAPNFAAPNFAAPGPASPAAQEPEPSPAPALPGLPPLKRFGETLLLRRCLLFSAKSLLDRQSDVDNHDWVLLAVENRCPVAVLNLRVELLLLDTRGQLYGKTFWVLGRGERLEPGARWEDSVPIPDPSSRVARAWTLRVLRADTPARRRPAPALPPRDPR